MKNLKAMTSSLYDLWRIKFEETNLFLCTIHSPRLHVADQIP